MPSLGIDQTLENDLNVGPESVERTLSGKGYRITRKQRMEKLKAKAEKLNGREVQEGPEL